MIRIFTHELPCAPVEEDILDALALLPQWRKEKALKYRRPRDRYLCAEAFLLLREALEKCCGIDGDISFVYGPSGKPGLAGHEDIHFNISHCSGCVACAIGDSPVGIDVEDIQYDEALVDAVLNGDEAAMVRSAEKPAVEFTRLWTMKESLLKMTGEGIRDDMKGVLAGSDARFETRINEVRGYVLSATERDC